VPNDFSSCDHKVIRCSHQHKNAQDPGHMSQNVQDLSFQNVNVSCSAPLSLTDSEASGTRFQCCKKRERSQMSVMLHMLHLLQWVTALQPEQNGKQCDSCDTCQNDSFFELTFLMCSSAVSLIPHCHWCANFVLPPLPTRQKLHLSEEVPFAQTQHAWLLQLASCGSDIWMGSNDSQRWVVKEDSGHPLSKLTTTAAECIARTNIAP